MTEPSDTAVVDGAPAPSASDPDPADPSVSAAAATSESPEDEAPTSQQLADAGALTGQALAEHLGSDDLEAHAAAQAAQGVKDGTEAPPGATKVDDHAAALAAWLENPTYTVAMNVGATTFSTCDLCGVVVGPAHDWHTDQHRRGG